MSCIDIQIADQQQLLTLDLPQLRRTVNHVLTHLAVDSAAVSVAVVDDQTIAQLKMKYFGRPDATDVLSFDLADQSSDLADPAGTLDCEIIINAQRALKAAGSHEPAAELNLYLVHGLLHQLGYDDQEPRQAQAMHDKEDELLQELGFGAVYRRNAQPDSTVCKEHIEQ